MLFLQKGGRALLTERKVIGTFLSLRPRPMYQFVQQPNPVSGKLEWKVQNKDEYDYFRDVARSSYADMLHDMERNKMYYKAITLAVKKMHGRGMKAKVLDIGTGTGLLSMMAATAGADTITAIEVFEPMAKVAKLVTEANGFGHIKVINKHSTEVTIGPEGDMQDKANIIITELFDTELIGEGALEAYHHAHVNLMEEDCIAVPHSATTYVQIVESEMMWAWHALEPIEVRSSSGEIIRVEPDPEMRECPGVPAVHDIQLSQVKENQFTKLTDPVEVFKFDWGSKSLTAKPRSVVIGAKATGSGRAQVALSWWMLDMDQEGHIILSTAPYWNHPNPRNMQWRDHWIQSVYFLPNAFQVGEGDSICISAHHDAYSMWFDARIGDCIDGARPSTPRPACEYLPRMLWSRPRLGMLNDDHRNKMFVEALKRVSFGNSKEHTAVCVSDVSLLPLLVAKSCFTKGHVYSLETDHIGQRGLQKIVECNDLSDSITIVDRFSQNGEGDCFKGGSINFLVGEPFFTSSLLPWHDLRFWYVRSELNDRLNNDAQIMPLRANLHIAAVQFEHLWKIRAPVGVVEGFDVSIMDEMINGAMEVQEYHEPEPHALWEYPCKLLGSPKKVMSFDFTACVPEQEISSSGTVFFNTVKGEPRICHGIALWMTYDLDDVHTLSTGLLTGFDDNKTPCWNMHHKQGVFFLRDPIFASGAEKQGVDYQMTFIPTSGDIKMKFHGR